MPNRVEGTGALQPDLMIVGEAPGAQEDQYGIPFYPDAPTGRIITDILRKNNLGRADVYITNVSKYRPPMNDFSKLHLVGVDIDKEIEELWANEIRVLKPKCILAVGNEALKAICGLDGILNYRGSILSSRDGDYKVVPCIHPAALFAHGGADDIRKGGLEWTYIKLIEADIARAIEESRTKEFNLPSRELDIAHNSLDAYRFFENYAKLDLAASDIESINCVPVCISFAFNRSHAISIPLLRNIGKHKLTDMGDRELNEVWRLIDRNLRRLRLIGHNFKYDEYKLSLAGFGGMKVFSDTLLKTRVIFPEMPQKRLNDVSSLWTREPYYKEEGKEFKLGKSKIEQLLLYNAKDSAVCKEIDEEQENDLVSMQETFGVPLVDYYYKYVMRKHSFYLKMENKGMLVDNERKAELKKKYTEMEMNVHNKITAAIGHELNVKSTPQMFDFLYKEMKFKFMKRNPTSEDTIVRLMANHGKDPKKKAVLTDILEERRIRTQKSNYINFTPDYDNTCKTTFNIIATETCRSSTGILKKPLRPKKMGLSWHTISAHGRLAKDIKSMFKPRPGKVFIKADSSQAEARVVAVLSKQWDLLEVFDKIDIHRRTAALILGYLPTLDLRPIKIPIIDDMEKDGPERFCGKKTRHAGNYRMGKGEFMLNLNTDAQKFEIDLSISEWKAGEMIKKFREADPRLETNFWNDIIEALSNSRTIIDPFGGVRVFNGRMGDEIFKEGFANIPQRTVSHLVQGAGVAVQDEIGWDNNDGYFIAEKHDELIMEVPENEVVLYAKLLKKYMEKPIDFSTYCTLKRDYILTIPCEIEFSNTHYGKWEKVKLAA